MKLVDRFTRLSRKSIIYPAIVLTLLYSSNSAGDWEVFRKVNEMTDEIYCALACKACGKYKEIGGNVSVIVWESEIEHGNLPGISAFFSGEEKEIESGYFRVDKNKAIRSDEQELDSIVIHHYRSNYEIMVEQMKKGQLLRVSNGDQIGRIDLNGFTIGYREFLKCPLPQNTEERKQAEEEALLQINSLRDAYILAIRQKIERNWRQPQGIGEMPDCELTVIQEPGGIILDVSFGQCTGGSPTYRKSIENAVYKAEPLPGPGDPSLFEHELKILFNPG